MPDRYIEKIKNLRTDSSRKRWTSFSNYRAPHKPFLLLSVIDLFNQWKITGNFIEKSYELDEYERDILYPLATKQIEIDLDDGVKVNYPKFSKALKNVAGLS